MEFKVIAHIHTDFPDKFGIPRQSAISEHLSGIITFLPEYRSMDAVRGLEGYDYIWLLWHFDVPQKDAFTATVRPPRLGGNERMGVFATRSPFRPNPIGLSCVKLDEIRTGRDGPQLIVSGIDLRDQTAIYDIKPYLPYADAHPDAACGFAGQVQHQALQVIFPEHLQALLPPKKVPGAIEMLSQDPRPHYQDDPERIYGVSYAGVDIRFRIAGQICTVCDIVPVKAP